MTLLLCLNYCNARSMQCQALPTARAIRCRSADDADDHIEQFIQRLDHLWFANCRNAANRGSSRCLLITSAIQGEGKTTLAAQLAARCGNAGMSTLLIDADLRRAALASLLDVPEGLGLSDLLNDEATIEDVTIPYNGGAFYFIRAGTPVADAIRLFQDRKLETIIEQLRQHYDVIIIDSPPVLPVPTRSSCASTSMPSSLRRDMNAADIRSSRRLNAWWQLPASRRSGQC